MYSCFVREDFFNLQSGMLWEATRAHRAALISVSVALSQTLAEAASPRCVVCVCVCVCVCEGVFASVSRGVPV